MQEITVTPLEAMGQLIMAANLIDTAECKDEEIYNRLQGAISVAETVLKQEIDALAMAPKQEFNCNFRAVGAMFIGNGGTNPVTYVPGGMRVDLSGWTCTAPGAAPAAANGSLTDDQINWHAKNIYGTAATAQEIEFAKAILAAAGPDAPLVKALEKIIEMNVQYCIDKYGDASKAETMGCVTTARAALSGAKGN